VRAQVCRSCVGPQHARDLGLRAEVERTGARQPQLVARVVLANTGETKVTDELPDYAPATRFVFLPTMVPTGLSMWKGHVVR